MMKRLIRTTFTKWDMSPAMIEKLKESLQEVGTIDTVTYRSKFHILFPDYNRIIHSELSPIGECNHVDYLLNGVVILQFFRVFGVAGRLLEENVPLNVKEKTEEILATYGLYTGRSAWKHAPWIPVLFLSGAGLALLGALLYVIDFLSSSGTSFEKVLIVLLVGVAIISIYQYKQYF